ncbi:BLUF domain-containing protein [Croceicoccus sp. YJ47]|uniref:BLUF domain-containing protein n=1 Tax=Croceicoccus sp. YJ47 TaxID=2798724 RepID=UPI0019210EAB|nr:BLUF domain-containing protein [Croceicoccus sp. YJ47]QQN74558.1 BLUF domain-containing protein [Croceicoccus sp. YJ47]
MSPPSPDMLCRLLYTSTAAPGDQAGETMVREIVGGASYRNRQSGVSGGLLFDGTKFVQVLEGPAASVESLFESICRDLRHVDVNLIDFSPVDVRMFGEWRMAFVGPDHEIMKDMENDSDEIAFLLGVNARKAVEQLRALFEQGDERCEGGGTTDEPRTAAA